MPRFRIAGDSSLVIVAGEPVESDVLGNLQSAIHRAVRIATQHPITQVRLGRRPEGVGLLAQTGNRFATLG